MSQAAPYAWSKLFTRLASDEATLGERQRPFLGLFALALLTLLVPGVTATKPGWIVASAAVVVVVSVAAYLCPWDRWPDATRLALPALQLIAVGLLRAGTGDARSPFGALLFVPVIAAAGERGRRGVAVATVGAICIVGVPLVTGADQVNSTDDVRRVILLPLAVLISSLTVNAWTERLRTRTDNVEALRASQQVLLVRSTADAALLRARSEELQAARDQFASVIEAATEQSIIGTDARGLIEVFNPGAERLLGVRRIDVVSRRRITELHDPDELVARSMPIAEPGSPVAVELGRELMERRGPNQPQDPFDVLVAAVRSSTADVRDWTYVRADGTGVNVQLAVTQRLDPDGNPNGYIFVATDVTAEGEAARLTDEFVSLISHELRTPLSSILGYLELTLDDEHELSGAQRQYLEVVERNANRLLHLVGDLLFTAQVEAGKFAIVHRAIDLSHTVRAAVASARPVAVGAGVELATMGTDNPVQFEGDAIRIGQALDNLISNAIKFTPAGGTVVVDLSIGLDVDGHLPQRSRSATPASASPPRSSSSCGGGSSGRRPRPATLCPASALASPSPRRSSPHTAGRSRSEATSGKARRS